MRQRRPTVLSTVVTTAALLAAALPVTPALAAPPVTCGMTVTTDITLTDDLTCPGPGLIIGADGLTIDLAGHTLTGAGPDDNADTGIYAEGRSDLRIRRGAITGFQLAINLNEVRDVALHDLQLNSDTSRATMTRALAIYSSQNIEILDSQIGRSSNRHSSYAERSSSIRVERTHIRGYADWVSCSEVSVTRSTVTDGALSFQILTNRIQVRHNRLLRSAVLSGETSQLTVADNYITGPVRAAVDVDVEYSHNTLVERNVIANAARGVVIGLLPGKDTHIRRNLFVGNDYGVALDVLSILSVNTVIDNNRFIENRQAGVFIQDEGSPSAGASTSITRNAFVRNGYGGTDTDAAGRRINDGLHTNLPIGSPLTISDNHTSGNADHGIEALPAGSVIDGGGNRSTGDPNGCAGVTCGDPSRPHRSPRRLLPTVAVQTLQRFMHRNLVVPILDGRRSGPPKPLLALVRRVPAVSAVPAYLIGVGLRPEHAPTYARRSAAPVRPAPVRPDPLR